MKNGILSFLLLSAAIVMLPSVSSAQNSPFSGSGDSKLPVEVTADNTIEWIKSANQYKAVGNARAAQGKNSVTCDTLIADYDPEKGQSDIKTLTATGNVVLTDSVQTVKGDRAVYDVKTGHLTVTGNGVSLKTPTQDITATKSLEYFNNDQKAIAIGNVKASDGKNTVHADKMISYFTKKDGKTVLKSAETFGGTRIVTPTEIALGDKGTYDAETQKAVLTGNVKITRGENQLNGERAEIDMKTGVSQIFGGEPGSGKRVRALFIPEKKSENAKQ